jgi:N-acetylmuramoyl-L-alanine amidase CwlA
MKIIDYISRKENYGSTRPLGKIKYIVIHYTSNDGDTAKNNCIYFRREIVKASAHYFVDDNSIYRSVPDNYNAYSVGAKKYRHPYCRNSNSISIELCDTRRNGTYDFTSKTIQNAVELTKELMQKYNIPLDNVIRHYDVTGKVCPRPFVEDRQAWESFKSKLITPVNTNKYKVNEAVQTRFQVRVVSATDNDHFKVESNGYYFELHKTMVSPINSDMIGDVIQRGVIFAILNHDTYGIEILDRQFQIKEYYIEKKL